MEKLSSSPAAAGDVIEATPQKIRLSSADDVRLEMARVYREMRSGTMDVKKGCSLVYVLGQIGKMVEITVVEKRLEQMEKTLGDGYGS